MSHKANNACTRSRLLVLALLVCIAALLPATTGAPPPLFLFPRFTLSYACKQTKQTRKQNAAEGCPEMCDCRIPTMITCESKNLAAVPVGLPLSSGLVVSLFLSRNEIMTLSRTSISATPTTLTDLLVAQNLLTRIAADAFVNLPLLEVFMVCACLILKFVVNH